MPTLREIRRRIQSVEKTEKITAALKIVSTVKVRNAQAALFASRPYASRLMEMIRQLVVHEAPQAHPLLAEREEKHLIITVLTSDKGLCGSFNHQIIRYAEKMADDRLNAGEDVALICIGRKGWEHFRSRGYRVIGEYINFYKDISFRNAQEIGALLISRFLHETIDRVEMVYNEFKNAAQQSVTNTVLLPLQGLQPSEKRDEGIPFIFEPNQKEILDHLLPLYLNIEIWHILQESIASEHGARMTAMDLASRNCQDMIERQTLYYHKARQSAITRELIDIVGAVESIK
jgi:F-type H+-transporting ATPase subunit gamma